MASTAPIDPTLQIGAVRLAVGDLIVVRIDDTPVGDGKPGPLARKLAASYANYAAVGGSDKA